MSEFPSAANAAGWAGLCPGNAESAGKRLSGRTRKGNRYLRRILVQSAWAVVRKKDCFLTALFYRTAQRRGMKKAAVAVAHRIVVIASHILRDGTVYKEFGGDHFDRLHPERTVQRLTRRLENLGVSVSLTPLEGSALPARPKRGRPCKCAERGLPCFHPRTSTLPVAKQIKTRSKRLCSTNSATLTRMVRIQQDGNRVIDRMVKLLETANCKLASVVSSIAGKTGQAILERSSRASKAVLTGRVSRSHCYARSKLR